MTMPLRAPLLVLLLAGASPGAHAGLASDLGNFFDEAAYSNTTPPGVYQGQTGGMLTGGGFTYRVPTRNYTLYSLQLPRLRSGCGGVDLFSGGFSFINSDQIVAMLRNIGAAAQGFAYQLAIRIISAQISSTLGENFDWARKFLTQSINSCEAAQALVGRAFQATTGARHGCVLAKMEAGESWGDATTACGAGGDTDAPPASAEPQLPFFRGNLAWKALNEHSGLGSDTQLAELAMTLTGTVIRAPGPSASDVGEIQVVAPILETSDGASLVEAMLYGPDSGSGGTVTYWECDDGTGADECLELAEGTTSIASEQSLVHRVRDQLAAMASAIATDSPLSSDQENLLLSTSLPVYRYLTVASAAGSSVLAQSQGARYAEIIARDILYTYLRDLVGEVGRAVSSTRLNNEDETVKQFQRQVGSARAALDRLDDRVKERFDIEMQFTNQMLLYQRMVVSRVPAGAFNPYRLARGVGAAR